MPDLATLPNGAHVFVDTNIFYLHFQGKSATCTAFFNRIANGQVTAYVNTEVLSDLIHKLMLAEAFAKGIIRRQKACDLKSYLASDRTCIACMPDHQGQFENTLGMGLKVLPVTKRLLIDTKSERTTHGLMTNDSLHLGSMIRRSVAVSDIATQDGDFIHIPDITVWRPEDVIT